MPRLSMYQVQCNYCGFWTSADEYGTYHAPLHLKIKHGIDEPEEYSNHFHFMTVRSDPLACIYDAIRKSDKGISLDDVNDISMQVYGSLKEEGYMFYFKVTEGDDPEEW